MFTTLMEWESRTKVVYGPRTRGVEKKRWRVPITVLVFAICIVATLYGTYWVLSHPKFTIANISISGVATLREEGLRAVINSYLSEQTVVRISRGQYFFASPGALEELLRQHFPKIKEITAVKEMPNTLSFFINERDTWGILCNFTAPVGQASTTPRSTQASNCAYIDHEGFAFAESPILEGFLTKKIYTDETDLYIGQSAVPKSAVIFYENMMRAFSAAGISIPSTEYIKELPRDAKVYAGRWYVLVARDADPQKIADVLKPLIDTELKGKMNALNYIDMRFGNKVFYKLRGDAN